jgi:hypothetical protein
MSKLQWKSHNLCFVSIHLSNNNCMGVGRGSICSLSGTEVVYIVMWVGVIMLTGK